MFVIVSSPIVVLFLPANFSANVESKLPPRYFVTMQIFVDREEHPFRGDEENFLPFPAFQVFICLWTINRTDVVGQIVSLFLR